MKHYYNNISIKFPEWAKKSCIYEVNIRQFTPEGTFKSFEKHLERIKELDVDILWFMPIQPIGQKNRKGSLGSYYSIQNYTAINSEFGNLNDFKRIVEKAHNLGMLVIIDWVANHSAWDNVWTLEHPDFYTKDENGNFMCRVKDWTDVIDLNYNNPEMRKAMTDAMLFWIKEVNIDGFRCDVADMVVTDFWNEATKSLRKEKEEILMLAEAAKKDLLCEAFNMTYNWHFYHTLNDIAKGEKDVHDLDNLIQSDINEYPLQACQMFFTSNHDENTWNGAASTRLENLTKAFAALTFTIDGMPLIYNGQEVNSEKQLPFFDKDSIEWKENKNFDFYKKLIKLKKENSALWNAQYGGNFTRLNTSDNQNIFAYLREKDENKILTIINISNEEKNIWIDCKDKEGYYFEIFTEENLFINSHFEIKILPFGFHIFEKK